MANLIFRGDAVPVAQIVKITPANPEVGDTFTIRINGKEVTFVATDTLVSTVVDGLVAAWNTAPFPEAAAITATAVDADDNGLYDYLELKADSPGVPFRVETSTSDAGGFSVVVSTIQNGIAPKNEIQKVTLPGSASGGTFTLTFSGQTTAGIAYNADAAAVQSALEALSNLGVGDVSVSGDAGGSWSVEFLGAYAGVNVPLMTGNGSSLTGQAGISIQTLLEGNSGSNEIQKVDYTLVTDGFFLLTVKDPISGVSTSGTFSTSGGASAFQNTLQNRLNVFGTGGECTVTDVSSKVVLVEFHGTWSALNVEEMFSGSDPVTVTTIANGSTTGDDEIQRVALLNGPTGGTFALTFSGQTTAAIAYNADAATVLAALEGLSNIGTGDVSVSGGAGGPWDVTFTNGLGTQDVAQMTGDASGLTGGAVNVFTTQNTDPGQNEVQQIALEPAPEGGTFTLTIDVGSGPETTGAIAYNASANAVQTAIEGLASFSAGDVEVTGEDGGPWLIEFQGNFATTNVNLLSGDGSSLTGGGSQSLVKVTSTRSRGPNHFDDPDNWTGGAVPNSQDSLFYNGGKVHCLYGLKQRVIFTVDAGTDEITFDGLADFVEGQAVRFFTTDTLPAGLSTGTTYYIKNLDYDASTCQLSLTAGGDAIDIADSGTGTHTIALHLTSIRFRSRWSGYLGLTERNEADYYEYLPRSLSVIVDTITIGEGEGDGQARLDLDTGDEPTTLVVHQSGGSNEAGLPAIRWKGTHPDNSVTIHEGEFGAAVYATEEATIDTLVQHAGLVQMEIVTIGSLTKHGGELIAENANLAGSLRLHA